MIELFVLPTGILSELVAVEDHIDVVYRQVFQSTFEKGNRERQYTAVLAKRFQELSFAELEYLLPQDLVCMTDARNCLWGCTSSIFSDKKAKFLEGFGDDTFLSGGPKQCFLGVLLRDILYRSCLLYTSPSPRDLSTSRMPSSA